MRFMGIRAYSIPFSSSSWPSAIILSVRGIFEGGTHGEPDHTMLGGMARSTPIASDQATERRTMHNGISALLAHLPQLELHASPDTATIQNGRQSAPHLIESKLLMLEIR
jgi:hypothetical protein